MNILQAENCAYSYSVIGPGRQRDHGLTDFGGTSDGNSIGPLRCLYSRRTRANAIITEVGVIV